jgi:uncharacterized membrane protein YdbT with pleckstrin-like domain
MRCRIAARQEGELIVSYIEHSLSPGETVIYQTRLHWVVLVWHALFAVLFAGGGLVLLRYAAAGLIDHVYLWVAVGLVVIAALLLGGGLFIRHKTEMAVTSKRVIIKTGILTVRTIELFMAKIESVEVEQSVWGRMLGFGSIFVRGTGGTNEPFSTIAHPLEFRRQVQQQIELHMKEPQQ